MGTDLPVTTATVTTAASVKSSASVETSTEARLPTSGEPSCCSSMIKSAERAGVVAGLGVWRRESVLRRGETPAARRAAVKSTSSSKSAGVIEVVAVDEHSAVGYVRVVVVNDIVVMPVGSPVVPSPAKPAIEADSKAQPKRNSRAGKKQSGIRIPARPDPDRRSVHEPRVVLWDVNHLRLRRFDHNVLPLIRHLFL